MIRGVLVGTGGMGAAWAGHLLPQVRDRVEIVGLADVSPEARAAAGDHMGVGDEDGDVRVVGIGHDDRGAAATRPVGVADDEGRARSLYERLGFATVWRMYCFVQVPS